MARTCLTIILAAGEGTRMRSDKPKVLHEVGGLPMISHVLRGVIEAGTDAIALVVGNGGNKVGDIASSESDKIELFKQEERLGTAHAVMAAKDALSRRYDDVLVLFGDTALITQDTLLQMRQALANGADVAAVGFQTEDPDGYGRFIVIDEQLIRIREHKEASEEELRISLCNGGIMAINGSKALELVSAIGNRNKRGEYYLTDIVEVASKQGLNVLALEASKEELLGVNTRAELALAESIWQKRARREAMQNGVTMLSPETVFLHHDTKLAPDVVLEPNVFFGRGVEVGSGSTIRAYSHLEGAKIGEGVNIGPFARLRPGSVMDSGSRAGNFVEIKNAHIHAGAKINHLTYIGDADVGSKANIGAGTITCNYDGFNKHKTIIGANVFIGSNSSLVAPVTIGDGAYVASGSVITEDVPIDALGVARGRQTNKEGHAATLRERYRGKNDSS